MIVLARAQRKNEKLTTKCFIGDIMEWCHGIFVWY